MLGVDINGVAIKEGSKVKYTSRERTGTKVSYKRRGYETYAQHSDIEIIGTVKLAIHENQVMYIVETDQKASYPSYFFGSGKRSDRPDTVTYSLTKPFKTNANYEVIEATE